MFARFNRIKCNYYGFNTKDFSFGAKQLLRVLFGKGASI